MAEPGEFLNPVSAMLTRALAEAAAGYPVAASSTDGSTTDGSIWLVASYTAVPPSDDGNPPAEGLPPTYNGIFNIQPAYSSYQSALDRATELGDGYGVFGPFTSTFMAPNPNQSRMSQVVVTMSYTHPESGDTTATNIITIPTPGFSPPPGLAAPPPLEFDALFFSADAVAKFALGYYSEIYSNSFGIQVLQEFQSAQLAVMGHMPWSEYTDFEPGTPGVTPAPAPGSGGGAFRGGIPVVFHPDGQGGYRGRPIHPGALALAHAAAS